ncbi:type II toxin-antitoxin system CcdA family antitoxin [Actinoplanes sp. TRM 88003]|uniref:Type II toxin-antitoxin system CcdA family antitoxin n=1 Tax=Paractinoplanes aksuensis TaxID=2939490 RepID=A0ABT1E1D5_9ACTN|nr:type II toxin-antitoxin system VapB family antitoxin [Actinoplanes aksuensis]MCO8276932.1 type II toxin-antitoxin system CcdA family antitoxin [Actinoplanes aksuensis]
MTAVAIRPDIPTRSDLSMRRDITVSVTVDGELLLEAQRQISAESISAAVNEALRRLVEEERAKRRAAQERLRQMHEDGVFGSDADEGSGQ